MSVTVGLLGHNGHVGKEALRALAAAQDAGKIKLVVIHRPSSATDSIPSNVEKRSLDNTKPDGKEYDVAVKGINVLASVVGGDGILAQANLIPALKRSADFKVFLPSDYGSPWTKKEIEETLSPVIKDKEVVLEKAEKAGVAVATIKTGAITDFIFIYPLLWNVKGNSATVYDKTADANIPFTSSSYIAAGLVKLVTGDLSSLPGKDFALVEDNVNNRKVIEAISAVNGGKPTKIETLDDAALKQILSNPQSALIGNIQVKLNEGWSFASQTPLEVANWKARPVADYIKDQA